MEENVLAKPVSEAEADELVPGWRERERWLASTSVPALLEGYRAGQLGDELLALALLHHDVLGPESRATDLSDLVLYSSADAAVVDGRDPATLLWDSIARRLRWASGRRRVIIDPSSPRGLVLDAYVVEYLDANGRRTDTESDRRREAARDAG